LKKNVATILSFVVIFITIMMALLPGFIAPYDPLEINIQDRLKPPSSNYLMGTDEYGRDIFSRIVYGSRVTMFVGIGSSSLAVIVGVFLGLIAGWYSGIIDSILTRILDGFLSFPPFLLAILVISVTEASAMGLILTIAIVNFPRFARIVRSNVLSLKEREFVEASQALGASVRHILFKSILPNCLSPIIVQFTLLTAVAVLIEAGMSFLGLGIQPPQPAWGSMLHYSQLHLSRAYWYTLAPGITIFLVVLSINILGDSLRDYFSSKN